MCLVTDRMKILMEMKHHPYNLKKPPALLYRAGGHNGELK